MTCHFGIRTCPNKKREIQAMLLTIDWLNKDIGLQVLSRPYNFTFKSKTESWFVFRFCARFDPIHRNSYPSFEIMQNEILTVPRL